MAIALYADRRDAGRQLVAPLRELVAGPALVLGLPRGGVPVAFEVASGLGAPLDLLLVRKLGVPGQEELAMGAIASGGVRVLNDGILDQLADPDGAIEAVAAEELLELERRERRYRSGRPPLAVAGADVIVVDDGLATGATMRAAIASLRQRGVRTVAVAVPVGAPSVCALVAGEADALVCLVTPDPFGAVGHWYGDFGQTDDDEVIALLADAEADGRRAG